MIERSHILLAASLTACAGSAPPAAEAAPPVVASAALTTVSASKKCELADADDGLVDDGEDGDFKIAAVGGRCGGWMVGKDDKSTLEPKDHKLIMTKGGPDKSKMAVHIKGNTAAVDTACAATFLILACGDMYDATKYAGLSFWAKTEAKAPAKIRFVVTDGQTDPKGKIDNLCASHFGKNLDIATEWKKYTVSFADFTQGAGEPRFASLDAHRLFSLGWAVGEGQDFDLWVDEVRFARCK
jgi:endoglucanase